MKILLKTLVQVSLLILLKPHLQLGKMHKRKPNASSMSFENWKALGRMVMFVHSFCVCVILIACVQEEGSDIQNPMDVPVAGCVDAEPGAGVAQKKSKTKKVNWLITYGASGRNITARMLMETKFLTVDECYTSRDSAHKYTLIHLEKRVSQTALENVVEAVCKRYGLVSNHVYGMEAIQSGTTDEFGSIRENPLLKEGLKHSSSR
jgi:hypothetical protein